MGNFKKFKVVPDLPEKLKPLSGHRRPTCG